MRPPYGRSVVISVVLLLVGVCFFALGRSGAAETTAPALCLLRISFFLIVWAPIFIIDLLACLIVPKLFVNDVGLIEIGVPILSGMAMLPWGFMVGKMTASLLAQEVPNQLISPCGGFILAICIVILIFVGRNTRNDSLAE